MTGGSQAPIFSALRESVRTKNCPWEVLRLKASPAAFVGLVYAADEKSALKTAIKELKIRPEDRARLLIRPHGQH